MDKLMHTQGPWSVGVPGDGSPGRVYCNNLLGSSVALVYGDRGQEFSVLPRSEEEANARLIADAPAAALVLALICAGKAEIRTSRAAPYFVAKFAPEFSCYITGTYTDLVNAIGWDRARAALEGGG